MEPTPTTLITGADRGIGLGLARHYVGQGSNVIATTRRDRPGAALAEIDETHGHLRVMSLDAGDEASIHAFGERLVAGGITLDLVINNAGVSLGEPFGDWSFDHFTRHFHVNTVGPSMVVQAIKPSLKEGSKVIQMTSGMASAELNLGPDNPLDAYAVSKCGLNILTRRLAEKLRPEGIAIVAMSPGWVQTDMGGEGATHTVEEAVATMTSTIARLGMDDTGAFVGPEGKPCPW
ncbi:MAG: SDR family oxidoreductase [Planctomycetota bacterium]